MSISRSSQVWCSQNVALSSYRMLQAWGWLAGDCRLENSYSAHQRQQFFALGLSDFSEMCWQLRVFFPKEKRHVIRFLKMLQQIHLLPPCLAESMVHHQVNIQPKLHPGPQSPWSLPLLGSRVLIWLHLKLLSGRIITSARHDFSHKRVGVIDV